MENEFAKGFQDSMDDAEGNSQVKTIMKDAMLESDLRSLETQFNDLLLGVYDLSIANAPMSPSDARQTADIIGRHVGECRRITKRMRSIVAKKASRRNGVIVTILKAITPEGWSTPFYPESSRIDYDSKNPTARKCHQIVHQRGPHYGNVGDACAGLSHNQLLDLERRGFVMIDGGN